MYWSRRDGAGIDGGIASSGVKLSSRASRSTVCSMPRSMFSSHRFCELGRECIQKLASTRDTGCPHVTSVLTTPSSKSSWGDAVHTITSTALQFHICEVSMIVGRSSCASSRKPPRCPLKATLLAKTLRARTECIAHGVYFD